MKLVDTTRKLSECPWCKEPGRIITHFFEGEMLRMQAGCANDECKVQPRTKCITVVHGGRDYAIDVVTKIWEGK